MTTHNWMDIMDYKFVDLTHLRENRYLDRDRTRDREGERELERNLHLFRFLDRSFSNFSIFTVITDLDSSC